MKSAYYAAAVTNAYRHAIDCALDGKALPQIWRDEVDKTQPPPVLHRILLRRSRPALFGDKAITPMQRCAPLSRNAMQTAMPC